MKKLLFALPLIVVSIVWTSWNKPVQQRSMINKDEVISCMNMETIESYLQEASTPAFANMHPASKLASQEALVGTMIKYKTADGMEANAYFIPSKKKSKKWLIVIQE